MVFVLAAIALKNFKLFFALKTLAEISVEPENWPARPA
jgi:hypothetical protein